MNNNFQYKNITLGSDPEFFITDKKGKLVSSIGIIDGTKYEPQVLNMLGKGFAIQTDNVLGEFNIPPATTAHEATQNIAIMKAYITGFLADKGLLPKYMASAVYPSSELKSKEAKAFGCSVDYNAWTEVPNPKPCGERTSLRSAGCHFHLGFDNHDEQSCLNAIKAFDLFLGVPSVMIDPDNKRRQLYGKAGCFRFTDFGFEYRSMSGYFISSNELTEWCFNQIFEAVKYLNENGINEILKDGELIQNAINNGDKNIAERLITKYNINIKY
jgi:hypothetical protein